MTYDFLQVGENGVAVGIDHIDELVSDSINNIRKDPNLVALMDSGRLKLVVGDGRKGHPPEGPYDAIHVGAAAPQIPQDVGILMINNSLKIFQYSFILHSATVKLHTTYYKRRHKKESLYNMINRK